MDVLLNFISEDLIYALGWTVLHSIWQGFLIAIIMAIAFQILRKKSAKVRYEVATFSLFMVLVSAVSTFIWYFGSAGEIIEQQVTFVGETLASGQVSETTILQNFRESCLIYFNNHLPMIVLIWLVGAGFFILRLFGGLTYIQRLKHHRITLLSSYWQNKVQSIAAKIPNKKVVQIFESASVKVPMVIGHLKPYILLPIGAINQLDEKEVEAIIAHELGHIFRNDFLLNIVLSFIEVFFYYHPAVWWISGNIRLERENCCDDIAIKICGNSLIYAKALVRLQEINAYTPTFAMPFSGQKNQLLNRIKRILNQPQSRSNIMERLAATCFLLLAIVFMSVSPNRMGEHFESVDVIEVEEGSATSLFEVEEIQDTIPTKKVLRGKKLEITRKDGEVTEMILDGKVIPKEEYEAYDYIETEDGITVKGDNAISLKGDAMPEFSSDKLFSESDSDEEEVEDAALFKTRSSNSKMKLGNAFRGDLASAKNQQSITKRKNEDGQTVIVVEMEGKEPVEIVVDEEEDVIIVEGNELGDGDTAIIIDENVPPFASKRYELAKRYFKNKEDNRYFFLDNEKSRLAEPLIWKERNKALDKHIEGLRYRYERERDLYTKGSHDDLAIIQKKLKLLQQNNELDKSAKEKEVEHLLERAKRNEQSLIKSQERIKKRYDQQDKQYRKQRQEQELFYEKQMKEHSNLFNNRSSNKTAHAIASELKRDGLIEDETDFSFSLSQKRLKIDGKKQSKAVLKKYMELYQKLTGNEIKNKSKYQINFSSN